jgi:hypothetical protein
MSDERTALEKEIASLKDEIAFGIHSDSGIPYRKGETHFYRSKLRSLQAQLDKLRADERPALILKAQREIQICDRELRFARQGHEKLLDVQAFPRSQNTARTRCARALQATFGLLRNRGR